jgi:hypothetical protein
VKWHAWNHIADLKVYDVEQPWVWPLPNVRIGVSIENQGTADERVPLLRQLPAAVRFISAEPLLGPVDLSPWLTGSTTLHCCMDVAGAIRNRSFDGLQIDGRSLSRAEAKAELERILKTGVRVLPMFDECEGFDDQKGCPGHKNPKIDWVITGSESGNGARPMEESWVRSLRDQCTAASVSFFFKQKLEGKKKVSLPLLDGRKWAEFPEANS